MTGMVVSERNRKLVTDAQQARRSAWLRLWAAFIVISYNAIGVCDIYSTTLALNLGVGEEANPFIRSLMEQTGNGWIYAKLALQGVITVMVLWFPHPIVLGCFTFATIGNAYVVYNNLSIAGVF